MNISRTHGTLFKFFYRQALRLKCLLGKQKSKSFDQISSENSHKIERIYVINLELQPHRWREIKKELSYILDASGTPLSDRTTRIPAVDAGEFDNIENIEEVENTYSLGNQLFVEPRKILPNNLKLDEKIQMSHPEIAIALSHIKVWRQIVNEDKLYVLILEDDVFLRYNFGRYVDRIWKQLCLSLNGYPLFDILYLSFKEVENGAEKSHVSKNVFKLYRGIWYLSGYVLSKRGAEKLLSLLPVKGPIDLWINHQFENIDALITSEAVIIQRLDQSSGNTYSVLPVLSKIGVLNCEAPSVFRVPLLKKPIFVIGSKNSGLTSLAMALSVLGYCCCSDLNELPDDEGNKLMLKDNSRIFDAYVNIGSIENQLEKLLILYPEAKLIIAINNDDELESLCRFEKYSERILYLPINQNSATKWKLICEFLRCVPPVSQYPSLQEKGQRRISNTKDNASQTLIRSERWLKTDISPWITSLNHGWKGIHMNGRKKSSVITNNGSSSILYNFDHLDNSSWFLREDTFPGNLALFNPSNVLLIENKIVEIKVKYEDMGVRNYSSGALTTYSDFLFGRFEAMLKPPNVTGLISGLFLHRNSPRQEIDIEFLGKYPKKVLLNVFYNPGVEGTRFDYGYRGTPILIDLGFDATSDFHTYAIEWEPDELRWFIDGQLVHKRVNWAPTPIPHLPMKFHVNLWPSKSHELAGRINKKLLPTISLIKSVRLLPEYKFENN